MLPVSMVHITCVCMYVYVCVCVFVCCEVHAWCACAICMMMVYDLYVDLYVWSVHACISPNMICMHDLCLSMRVRTYLCVYVHVCTYVWSMYVCTQYQITEHQTPPQTHASSYDDTCARTQACKHVEVRWWSAQKTVYVHIYTYTYIRACTHTNRTRVCNRFTNLTASGVSAVKWYICSVSSEPAVMICMCMQFKDMYVYAWKNQSMHGDICLYMHTNTLYTHVRTWTCMRIEVYTQYDGSMYIR